MSIEELAKKWGTKNGQIWKIDSHKLMCGDSANRDDVLRFMGDERVDLLFTSPPYAQQRIYDVEFSKYLNNWDGLMQAVFASIPSHDLTQILVNLCFFHSKNEWIVYWDKWIEWMRRQGWRRFGWYVWDKGYGAPRDWAGRLAPSFEFIFHFNRHSIKPNKIIPTRTFGRKVHGTGSRKKDNSLPKKLSHDGLLVQPYKIIDSVIRAGKHQGRGVEVQHPAVFSVDLCQQIISSYSQPQQIVYDPFVGSGTTIMAAEQLSRKCYGMEISPSYVAVALERWSQATGKTPELVEERRS